MVGKRIEDWTLGDVREIVEAIRFVNIPKYDDLLDDELMDKFKDTKLVDAHQRYVVWKRPMPR
jgi:hypothetical protein